MAEGMTFAAMAMAMAKQPSLPDPSETQRHADQPECRLSRLKFQKATIIAFRA
jgi:hypothetical protein